MWTISNSADECVFLTHCCVNCLPSIFYMLVKYSDKKCDACSDQNLTPPQQIFVIKYVRTSENITRSFLCIC